MSGLKCHDLVVEAVRTADGNMDEVERRIAEIRKGLSPAEQEEFDRDVARVLAPLPPGFKEDDPSN